MAEVRETKLPGVGVRHEFTTEDGTEIGVLVYHDGRREILVYDSDDPDACTSFMTLSNADTRTVSELLGASQAAFPDVSMGSYPFNREARVFGTVLVLRSTEPERLAAAEADLRSRLTAKGIPH